MKRNFILFILFGIVISSFGLSQAEPEDAEKVLVIKEAQKQDETFAAVEAYLQDNILEVTVIARMYATKPKIENVIVVGPKLGRLSPEMKQTLLATTEEDGAFETTEASGLFGFGKKKRTKEMIGALTRALYKFKIPREKIVSGKRYELRIRVESMQGTAAFARFKFYLKDLPELINQ